MAQSWQTRQAYQADVKRLNAFLNPPQGSMPSYAYKAEQARRLEMWNAFVKNAK